MENPFVYLAGYWVDKYIKYFEVHWPGFFPSQGINISAPQENGVNHVNRNTVGRLKWPNAQLVWNTWLFKTQDGKDIDDRAR